GTVQRQLVRTLLARTELYPPGSDDALAAAARAANQADALLRKTAADDSGFADTVRLLAESRLHLGDTLKATSALQALMPADNSAGTESADSTAGLPADEVVPQTRALLVRIALADRRFSRARQWLDA